MEQKLRLNPVWILRKVGRKYFLKSFVLSVKKKKSDQNMGFFFHILVIIFFLFLINLAFEIRDFC